MLLSSTSIRSRLMLAILLTSLVVLTVTSVGFVAYELRVSRQELERNLQLTAQIVADQVITSLSFENENDAAEVLASLRNVENVRKAALYDVTGVLFAGYPTNAPASIFPTKPPQEQKRFTPTALFWTQPVVQEGKRMGTLFLESDLAPVHSRLRHYFLIGACVAALSLAVALVLSNLLQRSISRPVLELANTARVISERQDYSVRAHKSTQDEVGLLTEAFNLMLAQIQDRENALRESGDRLRLALEAGQIGTWDWVVASNCIEWHQSRPQPDGGQPDDSRIALQDFLRLVCPEDRHSILQLSKDIRSQGGEFSTEFRIVSRDGQLRHILVRGKGLPDQNGRLARLTGVSMDITDRKRAEEEIRRLNAELEQRVRDRTAALTEANGELEAFTYTVSHDLRAPLRHIDAFAKIIEEELANPNHTDLRGYVNRIRRGTQTMGRLVDDLLNLSRVGRSQLGWQEVDLNALVQEVVSELQDDAARREIQWRISPLPPAKCDPGLIKQVFANLLSNAIKYTRPKTAACIEVGTTVLEGHVTFYVRDNGVGFNMKYVHKLFGVFERLHRPEEFEGTGIGLATVRRIIQKHGGRVWAESEPNQGATFYFTLPDES